MKVNKKSIKILCGVGIGLAIILFIFQPSSRIDSAISIAILTALMLMPDTKKNL